MAYYRLINKNKGIDNVIVEINCGVNMFAVLIQTFKHNHTDECQTPAKFAEWINSGETPYTANVFCPAVFDWNVI